MMDWYLIQEKTKHTLSLQQQVEITQTFFTFTPQIPGIGMHFIRDQKTKQKILYPFHDQVQPYINILDFSVRKCAPYIFFSAGADCWICHEIACGF